MNQIIWKKFTRFKQILEKSYISKLHFEVKKTRKISGRKLTFSSPAVGRNPPPWAADGFAVQPCGPKEVRTKAGSMWQHVISSEGLCCFSQALFRHKKCHDFLHDGIKAGPVQDLEDLCRVCVQDKHGSMNVTHLTGFVWSWKTLLANWKCNFLVFESFWKMKSSLKF